MTAKTGQQPRARRVRRRDRPGHIDPQMASELRKKTSKPAHENDKAFISKPSSSDPLGEELGEAFVRQATSGNGGELEELNREVPEETGGPFQTTSAAEEFGRSVDASNPKGAKREPFPKT